MNNFKNIIEFQQYFKDEETCRKYLEVNRWPNGLVCPFCQSTRVYRFSDGKRFKCADKTCNKKFTVTVGAMYENTKIPLQKWFLAMYIISNHKKGISSCQLARDLGVTQRTAWFLNHRIREMHIKKSANKKLRDVVSADETFIGGLNKNRHADKKIIDNQGRSTKDKTPVLGLLQHGGHVVTEVIPDTKAATLKPIIQRMVEQGSIIVTDEWDSYNSIRDEYKHVVIKHQEGEYVRGAFHTNNIENFWSLLSRGIYGIYHQVSRKHLHRYCNEFSFRFNSRKIKDVDRFDVIVKNSEGRLKYKDLTAK
jgi:transposase-like protein